MKTGNSIKKFYDKSRIRAPSFMLSLSAGIDTLRKFKGDNFFFIRSHLDSSIGRQWLMINRYLRRH